MKNLFKNLFSKSDNTIVKPKSYLTPNGLLVEAMQFNGYNEKEMKAFCPKIYFVNCSSPSSLNVKSATGDVTCYASDYIVKANNEFYLIPESQKYRVLIEEVKTV